MGTIISGTDLDVEYIREKYQAVGKYEKTFFYPRDVNGNFSIKSNRASLKILLGNSGDPTNNHIAMIDILKKSSQATFTVYAPLSYGGTDDYVNRVIEYGKRELKESFVPLTEFMKLDDYLEFISDIDIAMFNHNRQQASNNIYSLVASGATVYMNSQISTYKQLVDIGVLVKDIRDFNLECYSQDILVDNRDRVLDYFSNDNLVEQLKNLYRNEN
jgi:hypothetical protein